MGEVFFGGRRLNSLAIATRPPADWDSVCTCNKAPVPMLGPAGLHAIACDSSGEPIRWISPYCPAHTIQTATREQTAEGSATHDASGTAGDGINQDLPPDSSTHRGDGDA